jgi:glutamyl-tRNA synthetase
LRWLGLTWDEGPDVGGPYGPYRQSERFDIYRTRAEELVARGAAYLCFCTPERLEALRAEQREKKLALGYDGRCRTLAGAEAPRRSAAGEAHVVRLAMPADDAMVVQDLLRGDIRFERSQMDDQVLLKSDGFPTYHLANVVADHLMGISHGSARRSAVLAAQARAALSLLRLEMPVSATCPLRNATSRRSRSARTR